MTRALAGPSRPFIRWLLLAALTVLNGGSGHAGEPDSRLVVNSLEPTALLLNTSPLQQVALLTVTNTTPDPLQCETILRLEGKESAGRTEFEAPPGASEHRLSIPDLTQSARLEIEIREPSSETLLAGYSQVWMPQRRWKVFLTESSHEDIGYEGYIFVKQAEIADQIERAAALSELRDPDDRSAYTYTLETLLFMRNYIEERSPMAWRQLVESHIKSGRLHLMGAPSGVHSHWMDYEELARMTYGRREVQDRFGLDLDTFLMVDNPSVSWSAAQVIADAGFKYIARFGQRWRTGMNCDYQATGVPAVFWWVAPDTKHRILFAWRTRYYRPLWYGQDVWRYEGRKGDPSRELSEHLKRIESGELLGPYPYDALLNPDYSDHKPPVFAAEALAQWHATYRYPEIRISSPTDFFEYVEERFPEEIPTLTGDLSNFSADYAAIDPESQGWKRTAARLLPFAEGISAIASQFDPARGAAGGSFDRAYRRLMDYDEHSWPTKPPPNDFHAFNSQWVKHQEGKRALNHATQLLDSGLDSLLQEIPNSNGTKVVVFNPLAHARAGVAEAPLDGVDIVDLETGRALPSQSTANGGTLFMADDIPPFGYRVFGTRPSTRPHAPSTQLRVGPRSIENQYYRIRFAPDSGCLSSIWDKELERELVGGGDGYEFNQLVYVHKKGAESKAGFEHSPTGADLVPGVPGAVSVSFRSFLEDEVTGASVTQKVTLYDGLKRIDVENQLRHVDALFSEEWVDRYKDNLYYAFPFNLDPVEFHVEYPGGVVRPFEDQLRWGTHDFLYANRWVNSGNDALSITMVPWEAGTVSFGEIRYNEFSIDYRPRKPLLFSYAYANRMAGLISQEPADCNAALRYSFTSHPGDWRRGRTTRFGWEVASPLCTRVLSAAQDGSLPARQASFLEVSASNVQLVTLKLSEQPGRGWIVRLVETEGRDTPTRVKLPHFPVAGAVECNLIEEDAKPLAVTDSGIDLLIGKHAFATMRIFAEDPGFSSAGSPSAKPVSDKSIHLRWDAVSAEDVAYNIFRSEDPDEPPTIHSLIARTKATGFVDDWLKINTPYYYYVAPVSPFNTQGPLSARISATTLGENKSPAPPVQELGIVRRAPPAFILYWRRQAEPDITRYHVFREQDPEVDTRGEPLASVEATSYFLQIFRDDNLVPGTVYYYAVVAEDSAGNRQTASPVVSARTPGDRPQLSKR